MAGSQPRLIGLDVLRFAVASVVIAAHANNFGHAGDIFYKASGPLGWLLLSLAGSGWAAVDIFFVLSGFLVSGLLFREAARTGTVALGRFLIRRGFKIYPAFWVMLAFTVVWIWLKGGTIPLDGLFCELFYFQNYGSYLCYHTWSLAVEEHFYFLLAGWFLILKWRAGATRKLDFKGIPDLFLTAAVVCLGLRFLTWAIILSPTNENHFWYLKADHAVLDSLFFGVMLSHFWHNRWNESQKKRVVALRWPLALGGLVLLLPSVVPMMNTDWFRIVGFIFIYLGAGCLLLSCLAFDYFNCPAGLKWLAWLGRHSYSVYLWHVLVGTCLYPFFDLRLNNQFGWTLDALIYFALCWLVGIIMAVAIEFPMLRLRDRWYPAAVKA